MFVISALFSKAIFNAVELSIFLFVTSTNVLIKFIPTSEPLPDEIEAVKQAETDIANGDVEDLASVAW